MLADDLRVSGPGLGATGRQLASAVGLPALSQHLRLSRCPEGPVRS